MRIATNDLFIKRAFRNSKYFEGYSEQIHKGKNIKPTGIVKTKTTPAKGYDIILFEKFMDKHDMTDAMTYAPREVPKNVVPLHELDKLIFNQRK